MQARSNRKPGSGGKRAGAGRKKRAAATQLPTPTEAPAPEPASDANFDPDAVLRQIASDPKMPATARVAAAKALRTSRRKSAGREGPDDDFDPVRLQAAEILQKRKLVQ
jgi:hypothetical protein